MNSGRLIFLMALAAATIQLAVGPPIASSGACSRIFAIAQITRRIGRYFIDVKGPYLVRTPEHVSPAEARRTKCVRGNSRSRSFWRGCH